MFASWVEEWESSDPFALAASSSRQQTNKRKFCAKARVKQKAHSLCSFDVTALSVSCGI
jgi:hypothetical protein